MMQPVFQDALAALDPCMTVAELVAEGLHIHRLHEVIVTILLNFVAIYSVNYFILNPYLTTEVQNPESKPKSTK